MLRRPFASGGVEHTPSETPSPSSRVDELEAYAEAIAGCTRCRLAQGRTQVVFGAGNPHADLMFVGEAPASTRTSRAYRSSARRASCSGAARGVGLRRAGRVHRERLKCRPPGNRDPRRDEIEACERHLFRQIELIEPEVVATLGNFATKLLSGRPLGITRVHGQEQRPTIGGRSVLLYPLYHPAAALYTPAMLKVLESDFARLPGAVRARLEPARRGDLAGAGAGPADAPAEQLGLLQAVALTELR